MAEKSSVRCVTPRCVNTIAKYGEGYHMVYARDNRGEDATHTCEYCGARSVGGVWESRCKHCKKLVEPGELGGLFVPHLCAECLDKARAADRARGAICRRCNKTYVDCCC